MIALVDIDGTIADITHRLHFIQSTPKDWVGFHNAMVDDVPIKPIIDLVNAMTDQGYSIIYVTGRPVDYMAQTESWLFKNGLPVGPLLMRASGDYRPDYQIKQELYQQSIYPHFGPATLAIEDRDIVVAMWRSIGLTCLQTAKGDY